MAYNITVTNGQGQERILNGNYTVTTATTGYDNTTITPDSVTVVDGTNEYTFKVSATGALTLHVSETGTTEGTSIVGATFKRTDSTGTEYGDVITTNEQGNAVFSNVPFAATDAPVIYYKQLASDGNHEFSSEVRQITLTESTGTVEIQNAAPVERVIKLTDTNYDGLPLNGVITLTGV